VRRLRLTRALSIVDVETTGVHPTVDRVVQIAVAKMLPTDEVREWSSLVNPEVPIPPEVTAIHGITDEMVKDAPTFQHLAPRLAAGFADSDIGAYNGRFDMAFLKAEFERARVRIPDWRETGIDPYRILQRYHPRTLSAAYEQYTGRKLEGAHDALVDARAALELLLAQVAAHEDLPDTVEGIVEMFERPADGHVDAEGKLVYRHGRVCINFGKNAGMRLDSVDPGFLRWVLGGDFSPRVKAAVRAELERRR
jgi:DNA polymerase III subunit epsilon